VNYGTFKTTIDSGGIGENIKSAEITALFSLRIEIFFHFLVPVLRLVANLFSI
jgi:hypothetical protein